MPGRDFATKGKWILCVFFSKSRHPQRQSPFSESTLVAVAYNANSRFFTKCYLEAAPISPPPETASHWVLSRNACSAKTGSR
jgi:hypothetical protein